jgi:hypothetical protein
MPPQTPPESPFSYRESLDKRQEYGFAQSTVEATVWLICHEPKRLAAWLARHADAEALEKVARVQIKNPDVDIVGKRRTSPARAELNP